MTQVYCAWVPPRSAMMTGNEVETTVPESTATNIPTMRPEIAVKTSRAERTVSGAGDVVEFKRGVSCRGWLIFVNDTALVDVPQPLLLINHPGIRATARRSTPGD